MILKLLPASNGVHFALSLIFLWLAPSTLLGQIYGGLGNGIYAPPGLSAGISPYALSRYSLGNPYIGQPGYGGYPFYGKSSYSYVTPYGGYGLSGYEGPPYGVNTYWQPGVAYPPMLYGQGYGGANSLYCRDRSADCALLASSGQCASSASTRALCPLSCGIGCAGDFYGGSQLLDPYANSYRGANGANAPPLGFGPSAFGTANGNAFGLDPGNPFGPEGLGPGGFGPGGGGLALDSSLSPMPPFFCRDSHIFGCPAWAQQGFCQSVPEFMLNYCRASCGVCGQYGMPSPGAGFDFPPVGNLASLAPVNNLAFSTDPLLGPGLLDQPMASGLSSGIYPGTSAGLSGLYSPYFPYSAYMPPLRSSLSSVALGSERKEKQQRSGGSAKVLFSEDEPTVDQQLFSAGLQLGQSSSSSSSPSMFNINPGNGNLLGLPPSTLSTQHSSVSKLVRMDDLLEGSKKSSKSR